MGDEEISSMISAVSFLSAISGPAIPFVFCSESSEVCSGQKSIYYPTILKYGLIILGLLFENGS